MNFQNLYIDFLERFVKIKRPVKIVFDCSNGTAGLILKELFKKEKRIKAIFINSEPDGNFPAHSPNPLEKDALNQLCKKVISEKANLGIIFDGDGDRIFFTDEKGKTIDPDTISLILMKIFKPPYVVSAISSWRVRDYKKVIISKIGRLFMGLAMEKNNANLGMERSGHYYFKKFFYRDSGIFTAIQIINFLSGVKISISQYIEKLPKSYHLPETNFKVENIKSLKNKISKIKNFYKKQGGKISEKDGLSMEFYSKQGRWWFNLRLSNTENFLRLNLEAENKKLLRQKAKEIKNMLLK